jgi:cysteine desulfurase
MKLPIYLDNHSTTRVDPRVVETMLPYFAEKYGNASSIHHEFGWEAEAAVEHARSLVAQLISAHAAEVVFTSGATESINLALKGIAATRSSTGNQIITASTEHQAVLDTCARLERQGFDITRLPVDEYGLVSPEQVRSAITKRSILATIMLANNEIGTLAPLKEIGEICRDHGVPLHTDATQAVGKIPVDVLAMNLDLLSFSAHKMYGPKGIGALWMRSTRPPLDLEPQVDGGGHERGLRSGTLNVPAIVGFGAAAKLAGAEMVEEASRVGRLRDKLVEELRTLLDGVTLNGHPVRRLPNNANITFAAVRADRLMMDMKDIAVSSGSACSSASPEPSHVLRAIGLKEDSVLSSIRFGLGRFTTEEEIDYVIGRIVETVTSFRTNAGRLQAAYSESGG